LITLLKKAAQRLYFVKILKKPGLTLQLCIIYSTRMWRQYA